MRRVAGLCLLLTACATSRVATQIERIVDDAVAAPVAERRFAGVVLVARDGRPVLRKTYGLADRERSIPHTPDTPFMVMSVSKQFTAALIARLAAAGKLRLDDRVSKYLEHWPAEWDSVEVRHLLSHASGLEIDNTYFWLIQHHPEYWPEPGPAPKYEPRPLAAAPGTKYLYSNVGYTLLSMIAAKAGGRPFDDLLRDEVFRPLGLAHTVPERNGVRVPGRARGYRRTEQGLELAEQKTIDIVGAGDMVTTAGDLLRFSAAFDGDRFLPAQLRQDMLTAHVAGEGGTSLGYGWFLRTTDGGYRLQSHGGAGTGFRAFHGRLPDERLTVIVLSNVEQPMTPWLFPLLDRLAAAFASRAK
jgi:CubicO group peptidase (beta-lactamase class C family)